jgi:hypothetical protein
MIYRILSVILILSFISIGYAKEEYIHHDLKVTIEPENKFIHVNDTIKLSKTFKAEKIHFLLHGNLKIISKSKHIKINKEKDELRSEFFGINTAKFEIKKKIPLNHYSIRFSDKLKKHETFNIVYEGIIHHPIRQIGSEYARGFSETPGIICDKGVFLAGSSFWIPWFNDDLVTFELNVKVPEKWDVISQGTRVYHEKKGERQITVWNSTEPMDEVYLVASKFEKYILKVGNVNVMAFLRSKDDGLASKYLETTGQYLEMFEKLIGPYPYSKFALVENFWETGYGMPSFTLLGSKVIRFPFILHSSYPHELLHNWWGNSVFVDYDAGNWCEGITVYMADHLIKQQRGHGVVYRKTTLQSYTHYASGKKEEFPLTKFKARYNALSSSIGYGKSMMLFHMLRKLAGDKLFKKSIQHFYKENKFKRATYTDIRKSFEEITGKDLKYFFKQWVSSTGAPEIQLSNVSVEKKGKRYLLQFSIDQIQDNKLYKLNVPVAIFLKGEKEALIEHLECNDRKANFTYCFDQQPLFIDVDPHFDVFRKLHDNEIPATLSNIFGSGSTLMVLPSKAPEEFLKGYRELAETWAKGGKDKIEIKMDNEVLSLPDNRAVWLFGIENLHIETIKRGISNYKVELNKSFIKINKKKFLFNANSIILAVKNSKDPSNNVALVVTDRVKALPGLGRKLPHYGKYSYLAFEGDEPTNIFKGQWPTINSPMSARLKPALSKGALNIKLPRQEPLARLAPLFSSKRMMEHIKYLASDSLEGRGLGSIGLKKAGQYIADAFKKAGLKPGGDNSTFFQTWEEVSGPQNKKIQLQNVIGFIQGNNQDWVDQSIVLCAHYDHLGRGWPDVRKGNKGKIHYGADDNASGVSVMLELARILGKSMKPGRSIVFIAFTGEENGLMGSSYYLKNLKTKCESKFKNIMAAINLDTVGRLIDKNKLMVIGSSSAREWKFIFMGIGYTVGIESQLITQDLDASDQVSFIKRGIPAIQLFSGPHSDYHCPTDTIDKIDPSGLVKVAIITKEAILFLSERKGPLTFKGSSKLPSKTKSVPTKGGRRVGTGIIPDFSFSGKGVKIGMVSPGSPAEKASLKKGDVIIKIGETEVDNLREYSNVLKLFNPSDTTTMVYLREDREYSTKVTLTTR